MEYYLDLKELHNKIGLVILFALLAILIFMLVSFLLKKPFGKPMRIASVTGLTLVHLQFSIGLLLYFLSPVGFSNFSSESMSHEVSRFYILEHPVGMLLAIVLLTIGNRFSRKKRKVTDAVRYKKILIYFSLAFVIITYLIPWFLWN
jgi:hypothetical protein